jgi:hypothetical protein
MNFRTFWENEQNSFFVNEIHVDIEEIALEPHETLLLELAQPDLINFIKNQVDGFANKVADRYRHQEVPEKSNVKKYRVTLRYPRSKRKAWLGHYTPDTMYIYASSVRDAKQRTEEHLRNKLEPVENDETRRYPRNNYLQSVKRKHLDLKAEPVATWTDLVKTLRHVAQRKGELTPLDYFDENDLRILIRQAKKQDFNHDLKKLTIPEQRLLKRMYFHMAQSPWLTQPTKALLDSELKAKMRLLGGKKFAYEREVGEEPETWTPPTDYWSVFEPKTQGEENKLLDSIRSTKDVFDVARRYGISPRDLKQVKVDLFGAEDTYLDAQIRLFDYLKRRIRLSPNNRIFHESDYTDPRLAKIHWDEMTEGLINSREGYAEAFPFNDIEDFKEAAEWLWDFYKQGRPRKPNNFSRLNDSLRHVLQYRERSQNPSRDVPF